MVRTFAWVAAYMPIQPAPALATAPTTNASVVLGPRPGATKSSTASTAAKIRSIEYSRRMNTIAPRWIAPAIFWMPSSPCG